MAASYPSQQLYNNTLYLYAPFTSVTNQTQYMSLYYAPITYTPYQHSYYKNINTNTKNMHQIIAKPIHELSDKFPSTIPPKQIQYCDTVSSLSNTSHPSTHPTSHPTTHPTQSPTKSPTKSSTKYPTNLQQLMKLMMNYI